MKEYYSAIEKGMKLCHLTTWMDLRNIMLDEISERQVPNVPNVPKCLFYTYNLEK